MNAKEAVASRIIALCDERGIAINALAGSAGVSPSTVYSMLNAKSQNPGVVSLQKLCDGLGITLREFFNDDLFDNIEQEIKQTAAAPDSFRFRRCCFVRMEITIQTRLLRSLWRTIAIPRITYSTQGMATLFPRAL